MPVYQKHNGEYSNYPPSKDLAKRKSAKKYNAPNDCDVCLSKGYNCSLRYTANDKCVQCARLEAIDYYNGNTTDPKTHESAVAQGAEFYIVPDPCERAGHLGIRNVDDNMCAFCAKEKDQRLARSAPRNAARDAGLMWYDPIEPCEECGVQAPRRVNNNSCRNCEDISRTGARRQRSAARKAARAAGNMWYTPEAPCDVCGVLAPRRVNNNSCQNCEQEARTGRQRPDHGLPRDIILSRGDARILGLKVYRTGKACKNGHTGFRYVSTGNCVDCMRGD